MTTHTGRDWRVDALCRTLADPDDMFPSPGDHEGQHAAKTVCGMCPVQPVCLSWAIDTGQQYGVAGGLTEAERAQLHGRRPPTDPDTQEGRPTDPGACGTRAGWEWHKRLHQRACDDCAAWRDANMPDVAGFAVRKPIEHGTYRGAAQHRRRGEDLCEPCRAADNLYQQERRAAARKHEPAAPCGTRSGHARHVAAGEEPCGRCSDAQAAADWYLRNAANVAVAA